MHTCSAPASKPMPPAPPPHRGVWVAGNVTDLPAQVVTSAAAGLAAGAAINGDLIAADTKTAVDAHRYERVYGEQA